MGSPSDKLIGTVEKRALAGAGAKVWMVRCQHPNSPHPGLGTLNESDLEVVDDDTSCEYNDNQEGKNNDDVVEVERTTEEEVPKYRSNPIFDFKSTTLVQESVDKEERIIHSVCRKSFLKKKKSTKLKKNVVDKKNESDPLIHVVEDNSTETRTTTVSSTPFASYPLTRKLLDLQHCYEKSLISFQEYQQLRTSTMHHFLCL